MDWDIKITRKSKLLSVSNEWVANDYWLIYGRIINEGGTQYRPFKFVLIIDRSYDLWDSETGEELNYNDVLDDMIFGMIDSIPQNARFENDNDFKRFISDCNETIDHYNGKNKRDYSFYRV